MEEIKVGEYLRFCDGNIRKVVKRDVDGHLVLDRLWTFGCGVKWVTKIEEKEQIKSHSPNIIELVEIGDFVELEIENVEQKRFKTFWYLHGDLDIKNLFHHLENGTHRIVGIITKEQIMNTEYVVGDK